MKKKFLYYMALVGVFATTFIVAAVIANLFTQNPTIIKWAGRIAAVVITTIVNIDILTDDEKSERQKHFKTRFN